LSSLSKVDYLPIACRQYIQGAVANMIAYLILQTVTVELNILFEFSDGCGIRWTTYKTWHPIFKTTIYFLGKSPL
jgi:hypothetical protein